MHLNEPCAACKSVRLLPLVVALLFLSAKTNPSWAGETPRVSYLRCVTNCLNNLMEYGTDRYGEVKAPILVSILDVETRQCPSNPAALDERWRATRRERRNPAGANLLTDQPVIKALFAASQITGDTRYAAFARGYLEWCLKNLVDEKGFLWWGWHRHYDVFQDKRLGHLGNPHEIHAIHSIAWDRLWEANSSATRREIEAIWQWHVIDKRTGEINRHGDGQRGCDFAMSAGSCLHAFAFLHRQTGEAVWLERAKLLARYFWDRRNPRTDLFPDRPNAGSQRFDGAHFVTADTGLHCHSLLKCYELTGDALFKDLALAYLKAYRKYGYDQRSGKFWGSLKLDGRPVPGPRLLMDGKGDDYAAYEPRGHLDLWQPYAAGYEHPIPTAQAYAFAHLVTRDPIMLESARLFARCISENLPPTNCLVQTWYQGYAEKFAPQGTYAGHYGQAISFFLNLYTATGQSDHLEKARLIADDAVARLYVNGLFKGHPAKPYYEALDGVGHLLVALLQLNQVEVYRKDTATTGKIPLGPTPDSPRLDMDNW